MVTRVAPPGSARRRVIASITGLVLLAGLVACGKTDAAQEQSSRSAATQTTAAQTTASQSAPSGGQSSGTATESSPSQTPAATRTFKTFKGDVVIPAKPLRVVSLVNTTAFLVDLGVEPVGTIMEYESDYSPQDWAKVSKIPTVGENEMSINYEQLLTLDPDLIISTQRRDEEFGYDKLSAIAPTLLFQTDNPKEIMEAMPQIADAVGKSREFESRVADLDAKIAKINTTYQAFLKTATWDYVEGGDDGFIANSPVSWPGIWMEKAGLKFSSVASGQREDRGVRLSFEQISQLKNTTVILHDADPKGAPSPTTAKLLQQSSWKLLPAAKNQHVFGLPYSYQYSYKGVHAMIDEFEAVLAKVAA